MNESLFVTLQHADSFFPSGSTSFSWGLETLCSEQAVKSSADINTFIVGQMRGRWATCELPALLAAHQAQGDLEQVARIDNELQALALSKELREGAQRAGAGLLATHEKLGTPQAANYRRMVRIGEVPGQLSAVQGLLWYEVGLTEHQVGVVSGYSFCAGFVGAAIRMGLIGHIDSQRIIGGLQPLVLQLILQPQIAFEELNAYVPEAEIAVMRHEIANSRMFSN